MSRRDAREKAFMLLYQMEIQKSDEEAQLAVFIEAFAVVGQDRRYMTGLVRGVRTECEALDARFTPYLKRWAKERLPKIDLVILRIAVYEMFYEADVPNNVAISEAVLLCRKYTNDESRSYINAVLGRLSQQTGTGGESAGDIPENSAVQASDAASVKESLGLVREETSGDAL